MANKIKIRSGLAANLPTLEVGEPGFTTDTNKFYIGTASGNVEITGLQGPAGTIANLVEILPGLIEAPVNKTYVLLLSADFAGTVNYIKAKTAAGTLNAKLQINGSDIAGSSIAVSSAGITTGNATAGNEFVAGDTISLVISSISLPADLAFEVKMTRAS